MGVTADDGVFAAVTAAQVMVNFADCWSPTTEYISTIMGDGTGGPFSIGEGAGKWYDAASKLQAAQQSFTELTDGLPRDYWDGADRDAFDTEVKNLAAEIGDSHNYAMAVAITLTALTVPTGAWPLVCDGVGVVEAAWAACLYAVIGTVIGNLGASEIIYGEGEAVTFTCLGVMETSMAIMISTMAAATAAIVISDLADIDTQTVHGDTGIAGEFGKATVDSAGEVAMSLAMDKLSHMGKGEGGEGGAGGEGEGGGSAGGEGEGGPSDQGGTDAGSETVGSEGDGGSYGGEGDEPNGGTDSGGEEGGGGESGGQEGGGEGSGSGSGGEEDPIKRVLVERAQEKAREKLGEPATTGLSHLINQGASRLDPGWNNPDAPAASDENWGAGE